MILDFLNISINLKTIHRQGWIDKLSIQEPESVADHTFSMAIMGMVLSDMHSYNTEKILKLILLHDLAESITGDLTPEEKLKKDKIILENKVIKKILKNLPEDLQEQYLLLWHEYQNNETDEAQFVHQIDKLEMAFQAKIYEKQNKNSQNISVFIDSARQEIKHPEILKLFEKLTDYSE